jgi:SAM-dependent methyltransferase
VPVTDDATRVLADYDAMAEAYADDADDDPIKAAYDRPTLLAMAGDVRGRRVLDVGCATGALSEALVERGAQVVGIDLNERFLERARARLGDRATFHRADLAQPLEMLRAGSFDLVAASLVLHYLRDWTVPLREFARVLRPGGALILSTHHPTQDLALVGAEGSYFDTLLLADTWRKGGQAYTMHFYHRPLSAIVDALRDAGFRIDRIPEPRPDPVAFAARPALLERMERVPWFLFLRAVTGGAGR